MKFKDHFQSSNSDEIPLSKSDHHPKMDCLEFQRNWTLFGPSSHKTSCLSLRHELHFCLVHELQVREKHCLLEHEVAVSVWRPFLNCNFMEPLQPPSHSINRAFGRPFKHSYPFLNTLGFSNTPHTLPKSPNFHSNTFKPPRT